MTMDTQENMRVVKELYAAFGRGDVPGVAKLLAEDVIWRLPGTVPSILARIRAKQRNWLFPKAQCQRRHRSIPAERIRRGRRPHLVTGCSRGRVKSTDGVFDKRWVM
jgi:ketosteroid isomerase-like protein